MFKKGFNSILDNLDNKNTYLVKVINRNCPAYSHEHRTATKTEYTNNKLYRLKQTGCYLCNPCINLDSYLIPLSWSCQNFNINIKHELSIDQKVTLLAITHTSKYDFYLPMEIVLMIFEKAEWTEKRNKIDRITPELGNHIKDCRVCAEKVVSLNTLFTCSHHIIPRKSTNRFNFYY